MAILLLFGAGCKKVEVGPPVSSDPIFGLKGSLDGQNFDWQAGNDERYMLAFFDGDSTKTPRFVADLGRQETAVENDFPKIVIEFFGEGSTQNWPIALNAREVLFAQKRLILNKKRVLSLQNSSAGKAPISAFWTIGGQSSSLFEPVFEFSDTAFSGQIELQTTDAEGRTTRQSRFLDLEKDEEWSVRLSKIQAEIFADLSAPDSIGTLIWHNGSTDTAILIDTLQSQNSVAATFSNGKKATAEMALDQLDPFGPNFAAADFSWETFIRSDSVLVGGGFEALRVLVKYFDDSGREFRSDLAVQSSSKFFEILAVEDFERNEAGILTKKIRVKFDCVLADEKGATMRMSAVEGTVAVGVPD